MGRKGTRREFSDKTEKRTRESDERTDATNEKVEDMEKLAELHGELLKAELSDDATEQIDAAAVDARELADFDFRSEVEELEGHESESREYAEDMDHTASEGQETAERLERTADDLHGQELKTKLSDAERAAKEDATFYQEQSEKVRSKSSEVQDRLARIKQRANDAAHS